MTCPTRATASRASRSPASRPLSRSRQTAVQRLCNSLLALLNILFNSWSSSQCWGSCCVWQCKRRTAHLNRSLRIQGSCSLGICSVEHLNVPFRLPSKANYKTSTRVFICVLKKCFIIIKHLQHSAKSAANIRMCLTYYPQVLTTITEMIIKI